MVDTNTQNGKTESPTSEDLDMEVFTWVSPTAALSSKTRHTAQLSLLPVASDFAVESPAEPWRLFLSSNRQEELEGQDLLVCLTT